MTSHNLTRTTVQIAAMCCVLVLLLLPAGAQAQFQTVTIPVANGPVGLALNQTTHLLYVANQSANSVSVIDTNPGNPTFNTVVAGPISVGTAPFAIAVNEVSNRVYVANSGSANVSIIDGASNTVIGTTAVNIAPITPQTNPPTTFPFHPSALAVNPSTNEIVVGNADCGFVVIDGVSSQVEYTNYLGLCGQNAVAVDLVTNAIFVAAKNDADVQMFNRTIVNGTATYTVTTGFNANQPIALGIDQSAGMVYAADLAGFVELFNEGTKQQIENAGCTAQKTLQPIPCITTPASAYALAVNPNTNKAYVLNQSGTGGAATLSVVSGTGITSNITVGNSALPVRVPAANKVLVDPAANLVYVANDGSNSVTVIDGNTDTVLFTFPAGSQPFALVKDATTGDVYVANFSSGTTGSVTVLQVAPSSANLFSTTSYAFGPQAVGATSPAQLVNLINHGASSLTVSSIVPSGDFSEADNCVSTSNPPIPVGGSCTIQVTFTPTAVGTRNGQLTVTDSDPSSPQVITLSGTGTGPGLTVTPSALMFGATIINQGSSQQGVTVTNTGATSLVFQFTSTNSTGDFSIDNGCTPATSATTVQIAPGGACTIEVQFFPTAGGVRTGQLIITDFSSGSGVNYTIPLSGYGIAGQGVQPLAPSLVFGSQLVGTTSPGLVETLTNVGFTNLSVGALRTSGDFAVGANNCAIVAPQTSCEFVVTFTPTRSSTRQGQVLIFDNDNYSPQIVTLSGVGSPYGVTLAPATLSFGMQATNVQGLPQTVTLTNTGTSSLTISSITPDGDENWVETDNCTSPAFGPIPVGGSCTITVTEAPLTIGRLTGLGQLIIVDSDLSSPHFVGLASASTGLQLSVSPSFLSGPGVASVSDTLPQPLISKVQSVGSGWSETDTCAPPAFTLTNCVVTVSGGSGVGQITIDDVNHTNGPMIVALAGPYSIGSLVNTPANAPAGPAENVIPIDAASGTAPVSLTFPSGSVTTGGITSLTIQSTGPQPPSGFQLGTPPVYYYIQTTAVFTGNVTICITSPSVTSTSQLFHFGSGGAVNITSSFLGNTICGVTTSFSPFAVLQSTGTAAIPVFAPSSLTYSGQLVGTTSSAQTITVTNPVAATLSISGIAITGTNPGDFTQTNTCGSSIPPSSNCSISVTFAPTATSARAATVSVTDLAGTQTVPLGGTGLAANPTFSAVSLTFAGQLVGTTSSAQTITVTNPGAAPLSISGIAITGTNAGDFAQTNTCDSSIPASGNCSISVTFAPTATSARAATVSVTDLAGTQTIPLGGTGLAPASPTFAPGSLTFVGQLVSTTSSPQTITVTNPAAAPLSISGIVINGSNPADFMQTNTCGSSIPASGSCTISVTFTPTAASARAATVSVTDLAGTQTVPLGGTGLLAANPTLAPSSLTYSGQLVGTTSAAQNITVTNPVPAPIAISNIFINGANSTEFMQTNTCGSSIPASGNCSISVTFAPTATSARAATLTVTNSAGTQTVPLSGTGLAANPTFSAVSLTFAGQLVGTTSSPQTITVSNPVAAPLSISSIAISGTNPGDFMQTNTCGSSIPASSNCSISVTFAPTATSVRAATVSVTDLAGTQTVPLSGTGLAASPTFSAVSLTFAGQLVGTTSSAQSFTVTNPVAAPLSISSIAITGTNSGDFAQTNTCGSSVPPSSNCTISVTFAPAAIAGRTATLAVTDLAGTQTVPLSGTGLAASPTFSVVGVTFAGQLVGTTSAAQSITVTNPGAAPLSISGIAITGTNPGDFAQTNTCGSSIPASGNCTVSVTFAPTAASSRAATVSVTDLAGTQTVPLSGTGLAANTVITLATPSGLMYGSPASVTVSVSVSNTNETVSGSVSLRVDGGAATNSTLFNGAAVFNLGVLNAGAHSVSASFAAQGDLLASAGSGTFSVAQAPLTIVSNSGTRPYGANNPAFSVNFGGFVNGDTSSVLTGSLGCATTAVPNSPVGIYPIICAGLSSPNYAISFINGTLSVVPETTSVAVAFSPLSIMVGQTTTATITLTAPDMVIPIDPSVLASIAVSSPVASDILSNKGVCTPVPSAVSGVASCTITVTSVEPNGRTLNASFAGSADLTGSSGTADLMVTAALQSQQACIASDFRNVAVPGGSYVWFNSIFKVRDVTKQLIHVSFFKSSVQFQYMDPAGNTVIVNQKLPDAQITIDPNATTASTSFDAINNVWITTVPWDLDDNSFLTGMPWLVPSSGLPADVEPVTVCGTFASDVASVDIGWRWAAATYSSFSSDNTTLGVKPMDTDHDNQATNHDHAGTPENFRLSLIPGARGKGGKNYTGTYSRSVAIE